METPRGFQGWASRAGCVLAILLAVGCRTVTPNNLRMTTKYTSTYQCSLSYEEAYRKLVEDGIGSQAMAAIYTGVPIQHSLYKESQTATIFRSYSEDPTMLGLVTWWIIDLSAKKDGGCEVRTYGINPGRWETAEAIVRTLPDLREVSR
jgi:hypothetical protein